MKLNLAALQNAAEWSAMEVALPRYDVAAMRAATEGAPCWVHFGAGNLFRGYVARLQQRLLNGGHAHRGIVAVDTSSDGALRERIFLPHDCLTLLVALRRDGRAEREIIGSVSKAISGEDWPALKALFAEPSLQLASFTITEKGYAIRNAHGEPLASVAADSASGPVHPTHLMSRIAALLLARYCAGAAPIALVSMDNCSQNGAKLRDSVTAVARSWAERGLVPQGFLSYLKDESRVSFPWTMIDKITPRPDARIADSLRRLGMEDMQILPRERGAALAPFVNAETAETLVIEDRFPNGRPPLELAGVHMTDRETVSLADRMKVTVCLNPLHTALAVTGCMLGYDSIWREMEDGVLSTLVRRIGEEGMAVVRHPGILDPRAFLREFLDERLPNPNIPDTPQRIACDTSQKVAIRYGETIKAYLAGGKSLDALTGIPLAIASWLRYLLAVDDQTRPMACSPDPRLEALQRQLSGVEVGRPDSYAGQLRPILADTSIFGVDLTKTPMAATIESHFISMLRGKSAVRDTLAKTLDRL